MMKKFIKKIAVMVMTAILVVVTPNLGNLTKQIEVSAADFETAYFPGNVLKVTQGAYNEFNPYSHGSQNAFDLGGNSNYVAPFTGKIVSIYTKYNVVTLQSTDKVYYADGTLDYMTVSFVHDNDISDLYVGKIISQGTIFYQPGTKDPTGKTTGAHLHLAVKRGRVDNYFFSGDVYPNKALWIKTDTDIRERGGYTWVKKEGCNCNESYAGQYIIKTNGGRLNLRAGHTANSASLAMVNEGTEVTVTKGNGEWAHVSYNGMNGYMSLAYLQRKQEYVAPSISCSVSSISLQIPDNTATRIAIMLHGTFSDDSTLSGYRADCVSASWASNVVDNTVYMDVTASSVGSGNLEFKLTENATKQVVAQLSVPVTVTAKNYTVSFDPNGGWGGPGSQQKKHDQGLSIPWDAPSRTGYEFVGWARNAWAGEAEFGFGSVINDNSDMCLYAVWREIPPTYQDYTVNELARVMHGAHEYRLYEANSITRNGIDWETARIWCEQNGGHLATITTEGQQAAITSMIQNFPQYGGQIWIGGTDRDHEGTFTWVTGEAMSYTHWNSYQPDNYLGDQNYMCLFGDGTWDDAGNMLGIFLYECEHLDNRSHNPNGSIDYVGSPEPGKLRIDGWAFDIDDLNASLDVHVYVGGSAGTDCFAASFRADQPSDDLGGWGIYGNHRFSTVIDVSKYGDQPVYVYAINHGDGDSNPYIGGGVVWIEEPSVPCHVRYDANGGTGAPGEQVAEQKETICLSSSEPFRFGYTFGGWSENRNAEYGEYFAGDQFTVCEDVTLYAVWYENYVDLGSRSYSDVPGKQSGALFVRIRYAGTNLYVDNTDSYVGIRNESGSVNQVWEMIRLSDGSYRIVSLADGKVLDVAGTQSSNNTNVGVWDWLDNAGQRWYVFVEDGEYVLKPCNAPGSYLNAEYITHGGNIRLYDGGSSNHYFDIEILEEPEHPVLTVEQSGSRTVPTRISWTDTAETAWYNIYVYDGVCWNSNCIKTITNVHGNFYDIQLNPGTYQIHISAVNQYPWTNSNVVEVTVKETTYTVSYDANGGKSGPASQKKNYGETLVLSTTKPSRQFVITYNAAGGTVDSQKKTVSSTFVSWNTKQDGSGTEYKAGGNYTANKSVKLYAQWTDKAAGTLATPTRTGYRFTGWFTAASGGTKVTSSTIIGASQTVYAHWVKADTELKHAEAVSGTLKAGGSDRYSFKASTKGTYTFYTAGSLDTVGNLYTDSGLTKLAAADDNGTGNKNFKIVYNLEAGQTVYLKVMGIDKTVAGDYKIVVRKTYTVTYAGNGGTGGPSTQSKLYGSTLTLTSKVPVKTYTITYNANGGSVSTGKKTVSCSFTGWNTKADGSGDAYLSGASYTKNAALKLYAQWKNKAAGTLATPTRTGYKFAGWYTAASGGTKITSSTVITANQTVYAHWTKVDTELKQAEAVSTALKAGGTDKYIFKASTKGTYTFYTAGNLDTVGNLYSDSQYSKLVAADDNSAGNKNFKIVYNLEAGQTVYLKVMGIDKTVAGDYKIVVRKTYTVTYAGNGGTGGPSTQSKLYGSTLTLTSKVPVKTYTITYNANGGSVSTGKKTVSCSFTGWNTKADGSGDAYLSGASYTKNAALKLYAQWKNNAAGTLATPTRAGYKFAGWYTAASGGTKITSSTVITANQTVYAHWTKVDTELKQAEAVAAALQAGGTDKYIFKASTKGTYTFYTAGSLDTVGNLYSDSQYSKLVAADDNSAGNKNFKIVYNLEAGQTVYLKVMGFDKTVAGDYKIVVRKTYTVTYAGNGGTGGPSTQSKLYGSTLTLTSKVPVKTYTITYNANGGSVSTGKKTVSCSFTGWNTKADGSGDAYLSGASYTKNAALKLYAQWKNKAAGTLSTPTRAGYKFAGWYTAKSGGTKITSSTVITANQTVYAHWTK